MTQAAAKLNSIHSQLKLARDAAAGIDYASVNGAAVCREPAAQSRSILCASFDCDSLDYCNTATEQQMFDSAVAVAVSESCYYSCKRSDSNATAADNTVDVVLADNLDTAWHYTCLQQLREQQHKQN